MESDPVDIVKGIGGAEERSYLSLFPRTNRLHMPILLHGLIPIRLDPFVDDRLSAIGLWAVEDDIPSLRQLIKRVLYRPLLPGRTAKELEAESGHEIGEPAITLGVECRYADRLSLLTGGRLEGSRKFVGVHVRLARL